MPEAMSEAARLVASRDWRGALDVLRSAELETGQQFEAAYLFRAYVTRGSANGMTPCFISSR